MGNERGIRIEDLKPGDTINYEGWFHKVSDVKYFETVTFYKLLTDGNPIIVRGDELLWKVE